MQQPSLGIQSLVEKTLGKLALEETARLIGVDVSDLVKALEIAKSSDGYRHKKILKKRGKGYRRIDVPHKDLKWVQRACHINLLLRHFKPTPICHSFVGRRFEKDSLHWIFGRSVISGAWAHLGVPPDEEPDPKSNSINWRKPRSQLAIDFKDAFPSVSRTRIKEILQKLLEQTGKYQAGADIIAEILVDLTTWNGVLPQGAPTSPVLFNLACRDLDEILIGEFSDEEQKSRIKITRFCDDISVTRLSKKIGLKTRGKIERLIHKNGFQINEEKTVHWQDSHHVLRINSINLDPINRRVFLPRETIERFRYLLYRSWQELEESFSWWLVLGRDSDNTIKYFLNQAAYGRIAGIVGYCRMIYKEDSEMPLRLFSWNPDLSGYWDQERFEQIFADISKGSLIQDLEDHLHYF